MEILKRFPCTHYVFIQHSAELLSFSVASFTTLLLCSPQLDNTRFHLHPHEISSISPSQGDLGILPIMLLVTLSPWVCGLWHSYHLFTVNTFSTQFLTCHTLAKLGKLLQLKKKVTEETMQTYFLENKWVANTNLRGFL